MPKTLGLTSPLYEIPFDDDTLLVIGRIALMWGQIIFHLDSVMKLLLKQSEEEANEYERKSVGRKLKDLSRVLSKPENTTHRGILRRVHKTVDQVVSDRNVVFHGLWGWYFTRGSDAWRPAAKSWSREDAFFAENLRALHERMIGAAEALDDAWHGLGIQPGPQPTNRNRKQLWVPKEMDPPFPPVPRAFPR
jgi:hypothetical protein